MVRTTYAVGKNTFRNRWVIYKEEKQIGFTHDKEKAVKRAKKKARNNKPSEVIVQGKGIRRYGASEETDYIKKKNPEAYEEKIKPSFKGFLEVDE